MKTRSPGHYAFALALLCPFGCSLAVDTSDLDAGCPAGTKYCAGHACVPIADPAFGCAVDTCQPCPNVQNAVAYCDAGKCQGKCLAGFGCADCQANLLTDEDNCGGCCTAGEACPYSCAAGEYCRAGVCVSEP